MTPAGPTSAPRDSAGHRASARRARPARTRSPSCRRRIAGRLPRKRHRKRLERSRLGREHHAWARRSSRQWPSLQLGQQARLRDRRLAGARRAEDREQPDRRLAIRGTRVQRDERLPELLDQRLAPEEALGILLAEGLQSSIGVLAQRRRRWRARPRTLGAPRPALASAACRRCSSCQTNSAFVTALASCSGDANEATTRSAMTFGGTPLALEGGVGFPQVAGIGKSSGATNISRDRPAAAAARYSSSVNETARPAGSCRSSGPSGRPGDRIPHQRAQRSLAFASRAPKVLHLDELKARQPSMRPVHRLAVGREVAAGRAEEHVVHVALRQSPVRMNDARLAFKAALHSLPDRRHHLPSMRRFCLL